VLKFKLFLKYILEKVQTGYILFCHLVQALFQNFYLRQGGYVIVIVCLLATLHKNLWTDLHEIFRKGWQWANEQMMKFWWRHW